MRNKTSNLFFVVLTVLAVLQVLSVQAQERASLESAYPEREEINKSFRLSTAARAAISTIAGPVDI